MDGRDNKNCRCCQLIRDRREARPGRALEGRRMANRVERHRRCIYESATSPLREADSLLAACLGSARITAGAGACP